MTSSHQPPSCLVPFEAGLNLVPSFYDPVFQGDIELLQEVVAGSTFGSHCVISGFFCWGFDAERLDMGVNRGEDHECVSCGACGKFDEEVDAAVAELDRRYNSIREHLIMQNPDARLVDGLEHALVGIAHRRGRHPVAMYDMSLCVDIYVMRFGMDVDEALDYLDDNVLDNAPDENDPVFTEMYYPDEYEEDGEEDGEEKHLHVVAD